MSNQEENKDYFVPEQLDDSDFEKEKLEEKRLKKERKSLGISDDEGNSGTKINKTKIVNIIFIILAIGLIAFGIYFWLNPQEKKVSAPEQAVKDFATYLNNQEWSKINELMDFKGYYVLGNVLDEPNYTKFDSAYGSLEEVDEKYAEYESDVEELTSIDEEILNSFGRFQVKIDEIQSCSKIQGTDTLYKIRVKSSYVTNGQTESITDILYVSNASGEYKMVYGDWMGEVVNYYQQAMYYSNY